jgi:hypothetical protein
MGWIKSPERLKEGWVEFNRYYCKEGNIDCWMGDSINDPNNPEKSQWQLNSFSQFFRCNDGKWISNRDIRGIQGLLEMTWEFTAQEIWDEAIRIESIRRGIGTEELLKELEDESKTD